jgi:hypothetical protein
MPPVIKVGDVVKAQWFGDPNWYAGIVQKREKEPRNYWSKKAGGVVYDTGYDLKHEFFIWCPHRDTPEDGRTVENYVSVGYLDEAHEIIVMPEGATVAITRKDIAKAFLNELKRIPTEAEIDAVIEQLGVNFEPAYEWMESLIKRRFT